MVEYVLSEEELDDKMVAILKVKGYKSQLKTSLPKVAKNFGASVILDHLAKLCAPTGPLSGLTALRQPALVTLLAKEIARFEIPGNKLLGASPPIWTANPTSQYIEHIWARRVALSLWLDWAGIWPWGLSDFPRWQVGILLDYRPDRHDAIQNAFDGWGNGQGLVSKPHAGMIDVWLADPIAALFEALKVAGKHGPTTPMEACGAISLYLKSCRYAHGYSPQWQRELYGNPSGVAPLPGWIHCSKGGYYYAVGSSFDVKWGGCQTSSQYLVAVLRAMNIPAVALTTRIAEGTRMPWEPWPFQGEVLAEYPTGFGSGVHRTVYCYGANLGLDHADWVLQGHFGADFGGCLSHWIPVKAQYFLHKSYLVPKVNTPANSLQLAKAAGGVYDSVFEAAVNWTLAGNPRYTHFLNSGWSQILQVSPVNREVLGKTLASLWWGCEAPRLAYLGDLMGLAPSPSAKWSAIASNIPAFFTQNTPPGKYNVTNAKDEQPGEEFVARLLRLVLTPPLAGASISLVMPKFKSNLAFKTPPTSTWALAMVAYGVLFLKKVKYTSQFYYTLRLFFTLQSNYDMAFPSSSRVVWESGEQCATASSLMKKGSTVPIDPITPTYIPASQLHWCDPSKEPQCDLAHPKSIVSLIKLAARAIEWSMEGG